MSDINKLSKNEIEDILALTPMQHNMLIDYMMHPDTNTYLAQLVIDVHHNMHQWAFIQAWKMVIANNDMLRTVFRWDKLKNPIQIILKDKKVPIHIHDLDNKDDVPRELFLKQHIEEDRLTPLDLLTNPFRINLYKLNKQHVKMVITNHHILYDGWSNGILVREFFDTYHQLLENPNYTYHKKSRFKDYLLWYQNKKQEDKEHFWSNYFEDYHETAYLPSKAMLNHKEHKQIECYRKKMPLLLSKQINDYIHDNEMTLASLFYGAWAILLYKYSQEKDVMFGTTVSLRQPDIKGIEELVGLCMNTIPLRMKINDKEHPIIFLKKVFDKIHERGRYENTSLVHLKKYAHITNGDFYDSIMAIENYPLDETSLNPVDHSKVHYDIYENSNVNFMIEVIPYSAIEIRILYNSHAFEIAVVERVVNHLINIMTQLLDSRKIKHIEVVTKEEKDKLLNEFNNPLIKAIEDAVIHRQFEEQVKKQPNKVAVYFQNIQLTYDALNKKANRLAHVLQRKGIKKNQFVAFMTERSLDMFIAILAILKAGGAYIPIDPSLPKDRIKFILADSTCNILLTTQGNNPFAHGSIDIMMIDKQEYKDEPCENVGCSNVSTDLAYMIYTSGSTGNPKGVMIEHRAACNFMEGMRREIDFNQSKCMLALTTISFDIFFLETLLPLCNGMSVVVADDVVKNDYEQLGQLVIEHQVHMMQTTPSRMEMILSTCRDLSWLNRLEEIMIGGEAFSRALYKELHPLTEARIYNMYGPTETTIWSTVKRLSHVDTVNIGRPILNTQVYITNDEDQLMPIGTEGQLCISGYGLARGYHHRDTLNNEKFVKNVFGTEYLYKTGDVARWLENGEIEYIRRIDNQVKLRGYRIELEEIEAYIHRFPKITDTIVIVREDTLVAYIVYEDGLKIEQLRTYLSSKLPSYMVPSNFTRIDKIPLTPNGKKNINALPKMTNVDVKLKYQAPTNPLEEQIADIWKKILMLEKVSTNWNFFEVGGHSLKATVLLSELRKKFEADIALSHIFELKTVKALSTYIGQSRKKAHYKIKKAKKQDNYVATPVQKGVYTICQGEDVGTSYNFCVAIMLEGRFNIPKLKVALQALIRRHEALRTTFHVVNNEIVQVIHQDVIADIEETYITEDEIDEAIEGFIKPFHLDIGPLFRLGLGHITQQKIVLFMDVHHIIADGYSMSLFINELFNYYYGKDLNKHTLGYTDFSAWYNDFMTWDIFNKQEAYWQEIFKNDVPDTAFCIPTDFEVQKGAAYEGERLTYMMDQVLLENLGMLAQETDTTLFMVLLSALKIVLHKYTAEERIIIGTPVSGRQYPELNHIFGMFVNTVALKTICNKDMGFLQLLNQVKDTTLGAIENQDYPLYLLIEKLKIRKGNGKNPLFDIMFILQNMEMPQKDTQDFTVTTLNRKHNFAKYPLTIEGIEMEHEMHLVFEYRKNLFKESTIQKMIEHYIEVLHIISQNQKVKLQEINFDISLSKRNSSHLTMDDTDFNFSL